jgi:SAM-dependent methyltransferase
VKTDYAAHDAKYRALREQGAPGWDSAEVYRERELELGWALEALATTPGAPVRSVLELGCGAGNVAAWLAERGYEVTGVDISPAAIAWAEDRAIPRARFLVGDVVAEISGMFDLVLDSHCLHCIIGEDRARVLANARAALVPGGRFFVSTMCGPVTIPPLLAQFDPTTRCQVVDGVAYRYIGEPEDILDELRDAGLEVLRSTISPRKDDDDQDNLWALLAAR